MNRFQGTQPIVKPIVSKRAPKGGTLAVMIATETDLSYLCPLMGIDPRHFFPLYISRLFGRPEIHKGVWVAGPMMGAPYAVMILESLVAMGAKKILFYGWCGGVSPDLAIGDIILPVGAVIDEGTSIHYMEGQATKEKQGAGLLSLPSESMIKTVREALTQKGVQFYEGLIWTTDAIFRETPEEVVHHQKNGVLAVEMEMSALFSVGRYHQVSVAGVLVVSDEISSFKWRPGFRDDRFELSRKTVCEVIRALCETL